MASKKAKEIKPPKGADSSTVRTKRTKAKPPSSGNPTRGGGIFGHSRKVKI